MPEPADQPAKPLRTWRPMVLWTAVTLSAFGLGCFVATLTFARRKGRGVGRTPDKASAPTPTVLPGLTAIAIQEVLHSSDDELSVWNYNSGQGGTMPDITNTMRWYDGGRRRDWTLDLETGSLGWVEGIATYLTPAGTVYVLVSEQKLSTGCHATKLSAFRIKKGRPSLQEVSGFFPSMPGVEGDGSRIHWEYYRTRGDVFPRPFEVRVEESNQSIEVWMFPEACTGRGDKLASADRQTFSLILRDGKLAPRDFDSADKEAIEAMTGLGGP